MTRTLVEANLIDDEYFTDRSRGRGKLVAYFVERIVLNNLGPVGVPEHVVGYLTGLRKFLDKHGPTIHGAEIIEADPVRRFAGGIDLDLAVLGGPAVIDVKTSNPTAWHGLQLGPYAYLLDKAQWMKRARYGLYLTAAGGYRLKEYDEPDDLERFFDALNTLHWRCRHGSYERPYGRRSDRTGGTNGSDHGWSRSGTGDVTSADRYGNGPVGSDGDDPGWDAVSDHEDR